MAAVKKAPPNLDVIGKVAVGQGGVVLENKKKGRILLEFYPPVAKGAKRGDRQSIELGSCLDVADENQPSPEVTLTPDAWKALAGSKPAGYAVNDLLRDGVIRAYPAAAPV